MLWNKMNKAVDFLNLLFGTGFYLGGLIREFPKYFYTFPFLNLMKREVWSIYINKLKL
jgi:hypothetical protein